MKTPTQTQTREVQFFADEKSAGTLLGGIIGNPAAAVRALGPLEVIRLGCGPVAEKIDWKTSLPVLGQGVPAMTHAANDGVVTYYCRAPGLTMRQVATEFLRNYDRNGNEDGEPISFEISALDAEQQPVNWVAYSGQSGEEAQKS